jgi:hypothetical protein
VSDTVKIRVESGFSGPYAHLTEIIGLAGCLAIPASSSRILGEAYASTITFDLSQSNWHMPSPLTGNPTLALSNPTVGQQFTIILQQDGTGSRTVTWFTTIKWPSATPPTLTATANGIDVFTFKCVGTGAYYGFIAGQAMG